MSARRILAALRNDLAVGLGNQTVGYMLLAPILMAFIYTALLPIIEGAKPTVVAAGAFKQVMVDRLEERCDVIWVADREAVLARVRGVDDLIGVFGLRDHDPEVIFEGNEPVALRSYPGMVIDEMKAELEGGAVIDATIARIPGGGGRDRSSDATLFLVLTVILAALFPGMTIVEDREHGTLGSLSISPMSFGEYAAAKLVLASMIAYATAAPTVGILLGWSQPWGTVLLGVAAALPMGWLVAFLMGALAKDQISAMTLMKTGNALYMAIPVAGLYLAVEHQVWLKPLTPYWAGQALSGAMTGDLALLQRAGLWSLMTAVPAIVAAAYFLRNRLHWARRD